MDYLMPHLGTELQEKEKIHDIALSLKKINNKNNNREIFRFCQIAEKPVERESNGDTNCSWCTWNSSQRLGKETGGIGNLIKNRDHQALLGSARILRRILENWLDFQPIRI